MCVSVIDRASTYVFLSGVRLCGNRRTNYYLHLAWGFIYAAAGAVQFVAGIYFMLELPIFQLGSNIWTGAWVCAWNITICLRHY